MAMDPERLERQRRELETMRLRAERLEAAVRLKTAEAEAIKVGVFRSCINDGCGRPIGRWSKTGKCRACLNTEWMRRHRSKLRVVKGGAA